MSLVLTLEREGQARVLATDGELATLWSSVASPPGATLAGSVDGETYRLKVRSCKKAEDADRSGFRLEGRWIDLTRRQRERLMSSSR